MRNDILNRAIKFAVDAHAGQLRKDGTPYILHPLEDAAIVATMTSDPEILAAAVLHDTVEDTAVTPQDILQLFGQRVFRLVMGETENKRPGLPPESTWRIRKEESLRELSETKDNGVRMLWMGDKLSNMRALSRGLKAQGEAFFQQFHNADPLAHKWYYAQILLLLQTFSGEAAYREYEALYHEVFDQYKGE